MHLPSLSTPIMPNCHLLLVLGLTIIIFSVYQDVFTHSFVAYDDTRIVVNRSQHYSGITIKNLRAIAWDDFPREEPLVLRDLSYLINAQIFSPLNPQGYLLGNLLLHILVSYLVFVLALTLFPGQTVLATLAAIAFAVHPMHCEAVAWVSARKDTLYTSLYLLAVLAYVHFHRSSRVAHLVGSAILFIAALFSKSAAISFLPFLLSYRLIMLKGRRISLPETIYTISVALVTVWYIQWYSGVLREYGILRSSVVGLSRDWGSWALVSMESLFFYVTKLLYPSHLSITYSFPAPGLASKNPLFLTLTILSFLVLGALLWRHRKDLNHKVILLTAWFFCGLLPYLDLTPVGIYVANRYAYLSSIPFIIGVIWLVLTVKRGIRSGLTSSPIIVALLIATPLVILSRQTMTAVKAWRNTESLWENARQQDPNNLAPYVALMGDYLRQYLEAPDRPHSSPLLDKAAEIGGVAMARFSYGKGQYERALHLVTAQLGQIACYRGDYQKANDFFKLTFQLNPDYIKGRYIYATVLAEQQRNQEAIQQLSAILTPSRRPIDQGIIWEASILHASLTKNQSSQ